MNFNAQEIHVEGQKQQASLFPLVFAATVPATLTEACEWIDLRRDELLEQLDAHGAILLRGFPVSTDQDFDALIHAFKLANFTYAESLSNAVRVNRTERVFTANEAPPDVTIYLHHEMAQTPIYPSRLLFFCEQAAETGGQTPVCRSDVLLSHLIAERPAFVAACKTHGVKYTNVMPNNDDPESGQGRSWRSTLAVDTKVQAEARLKSLGYAWEWRENDSLAATTPVLRAVRTLSDGRDVFFNQLIAAFCGWADVRNNPEKSIRFGNDAPIDPNDMQVAIRLANELTFDIPWQTGDVVLVDNFSVMHGRRPFQGTRKVLASLVANDGLRMNNGS